MKKQVLSLALCLALTSTVALASTTASVAPKAPVKTTAAKSVVKKTATPVACPVATQEATLTPEQAMKKKFEEKMAKDREDLYCKLGFTPEQKAKAEVLDQQNRVTALPLIAKYRAERAKLKDLEAKKCCPLEIAKQKKEVKAAMKALKVNREESRKAFEAILNKDQLAKFEALRAERKAKYKKSGGHHKHHPKFENGERGEKGEMAPPPPSKCPVEKK